MTCRAVGWAFAACLLPSLAQAHGGGADEPIRWTWDPWVVTPLLLAGGGYAIGVTALWRRAGAGRGVRGWHVIAYASGWSALAGALVSPLHAMGEQLFTAHMVEHEIVMAVAAPLLVVARPAVVFLWAWPNTLRQGIARAVRHDTTRAVWGLATAPLAATVLHGLAIWIWHVPTLFDAAVTHIALHRLQHLSFLLTALLFWWALLRNCGAGAASGHLFITMTHTGLLGALLTFAPRVLYGVQTMHAGDWGLTPLQDQQLAGLVMWIPAGTLYAGAALAFAALWIAGSVNAWEAGNATRRP
jgi:cytochrome c oxidase assembly factor CtaG